jgi:preprotein translocase subunit SecB
MSENNQQTKELEVTPLPITIHTQYVRDISFENPNAPDSLRGGQAAPSMEVNIGTDARTLTDATYKYLYEVIVTLSAKATREDKTVFIAEVVYGAVVSVAENVPEDQHHPICLIEIPRHIFPYARQVLSDVTAQGGYPPLLLQPVDFQAMYTDRFRAELEASRKTQEENKAAGNA